MTRFINLVTSRLVEFIGAAVLAAGLIWPSMSTAQNNSAKAIAPNPHAQHTDKQPAGDQDLASQIAELGKKVARLEAALQESGSGTLSGTPDRDGLSGKQDKTGERTPGDRISSQYQNCLQCHQTRPSGPLPLSHLDEAGDKEREALDGRPAAGQEEPVPDKGMDGGAPPPSVETRMMDRMMDMMEKMMSGMNGGVMQPGKGTPAAGGMGMMEDDMDEMSPMQSGQGAPGGGTSGSSVERGMMKKMDKMMGMMEKMMDSGGMQSGQGMPAAGGMQDM